MSVKVRTDSLPVASGSGWYGASCRAAVRVATVGKTSGDPDPIEEVLAGQMPVDPCQQVGAGDGGDIISKRRVGLEGGHRCERESAPRGSPP